VIFSDSASTTCNVMQNNYIPEISSFFQDTRILFKKLFNGKIIQKFQPKILILIFLESLEKFPEMIHSLTSSDDVKCQLYALSKTLASSTNSDADSVEMFVFGNVTKLPSPLNCISPEIQGLIEKVKKLKLL
jgi:hypothetical protein